MQEPGSPVGPPMRRRRQERTVYKAEQRQELEKFFASNHYPTYEEREALAARLNLKEHQVLVWFKNRRAKHNRLLGLRVRQSPGASAEPQDPGICSPAPASAGPVIPTDPVFSEDPVFPENTVFPQGPGFCGLPPPSPSEAFSVAEPSVSSHSQASWDPAQGVQMMVPAALGPAPARAPVWLQGPSAVNFSSHPVVSLSFTELVSQEDSLGELSSSTPPYQEVDDSVNEKDSSPRMLLDL